MRLASTDRYLELLSTTLEAVIAPELRSADARGAADAMRAAIDELRKRESVTPALLHAHLAQGYAIAARMDAVLGTSPLPISAHLDETGDARDYATLREEFNRLTAQLALLAERLIAFRANHSPSELIISSLLTEAAAWERDYYVEQASLSTPPPRAARVQRGAPLSRESLQAFLRQCHPNGDSVELVAFEPIPGGFSKQTFRMAIRNADHSVERRIVRKNAPVQSMAYGGFMIENEFHLLRAVYATGLPVAQPLWLGKDVPGVDGDFYVMTELPGKVTGSYLGGASNAVSEDLLLQLAALLGTLHAMPPERFAGYWQHYLGDAARDVSVATCYRREIAAARAYEASEGFLPSPYLVHLFDWLDHHIPDSHRPAVLVHGDFNIHNMLAEDGRITGILDWECANFGASEQDLAWIKPHIAPLIDWNRFLARYRAHGGADVDEDTMRFCAAFNAMRTTLATNKHMLNVQDGIENTMKFAMIELGYASAHMRLI
ncbi:MAG: phosphotransferase family protein [Steroidobacteraceae bacterium]